MYGLLPPTDCVGVEARLDPLVRALDALRCPVAVVSAADGRIRAANSAWTRFATALSVAAIGPEREWTLGALFPEAADAPAQVAAHNDALRLNAMRLANIAGGTATWWDLDLVPHPDDADAVVVTAFEVTGHVLTKRAAEDEQGLAELTAARLRLAQDVAGIGTWEWDVVSGRQAWSPQQFRLHGIDPVNATPPTSDEWLAWVHPDDRARLPTNQAYRRAERTGDRVRAEFRVRPPHGGGERWLLGVSRVIAWQADGSPARILGVDLDVTERRREQEALRASEAHLRLACGAAGAFAWEWNPVTDRAVWAKGMEESLGLPPGGFGGTRQAFQRLIHPDDAAAVALAMGRALAGEVPDYRVEYRVRSADGTICWKAGRGIVMRDETGQPVRVVGMNQDITHIKAAEAQRAERDRQQQALARLSRFALENQSARTVMDEAVGVVADALEVAFVKVLQLLPGGQALVLRAGRGWTDRWPIHEAEVSADTGHQAGYTLLHHKQPVVVDDARVETRFQPSPMLRDHGVISGVSVAIRSPDGSGLPYGVFSIHTATRRTFVPHEIHFLESVADLVTVSLRREQNEAALREGKERFGALVDVMPQLAFAALADGEIEFVNRRFLDYSGLSAEEAQEAGWAGLLHPDDRKSGWQAWARALRTGETFEAEHRLRGADGDFRWFLTRAAPLRAPDTGRILRWFGTSTDILSLVGMRKAATLTPDLSRRRPESGGVPHHPEAPASLVQAQKLQMLGQVTATIVHDFRNITFVVRNSLDRIIRHSTDRTVIETAGLGLGATQRALSLTERLLGFGRQKAPRLDTVPTEQVLVQAFDLFRNLIGPGIPSVLYVDPDVWPIMVNADQLEVALLNLAINARDAMSQDGVLTLTARNIPASIPADTLPPGDYVSIALRDSGPGMPPEVLARATEPFFTTKTNGLGTGLGLAMVRDFAEQSDGVLRIGNHPDGGCSAEIVLPRACPSGPGCRGLDLSASSAKGK